MDDSKRIILQLDAINLLEASYALDMTFAHVAHQYQNKGRNNERIMLHVEVDDKNTVISET